MDFFVFTRNLRTRILRLRQCSFIRKREFSRRRKLLLLAGVGALGGLGEVDVELDEALEALELLLPGDDAVCVSVMR